MKTLLALALVLALAGPAAAQEQKSLREAAREYGLEGLEDYVPGEVLDGLVLPDAAQWNRFWRSLYSVRSSGSLEELAWLLPEAEAALKVLDASPGGKPYADWLRQRVDYLELAEYVSLYLPADGSPAPRATPVRRASAPGLAPPPRKETAVRPEVEKERAEAVSSYRLWKQRLAGRKPPARAAKLVPGLKKIFAAAGVPPELVWLAEVESSFNPEARSPVGALGLYQFMPATARRFGIRTEPRDERVDPERSACGAAAYLKLLYGQFNSWPLALAAYNAGEGRVGRVLKRTGAKDFSAAASELPAETRMYVPKVLATIYHREGVEPERLAAPN